MNNQAADVSYNSLLNRNEVKPLNARRASSRLQDKHQNLPRIPSTGSELFHGESNSQVFGDSNLLMSMPQSSNYNDRQDAYEIEQIMGIRSTTFQKSSELSKSAVSQQ